MSKLSSHCIRGGGGRGTQGGGGANITHSEQTCLNCQHNRSKLYVAVDRGVNSAFGTQKRVAAGRVRGVAVGEGLI